MTVKDLNLEQRLKEEAAFLLNYRSSNFDKQAYCWGKENLDEFSVDQLRECIAVEEKHTSYSKRSDYGKENIDLLKAKINERILERI